MSPQHGVLVTAAAAPMPELEPALELELVPLMILWYHRIFYYCSHVLKVVVHQDDNS